MSFVIYRRKMGAVLRQKINYFKKYAYLCVWAAQLDNESTFMNNKLSIFDIYKCCFLKFSWGQLSRGEWCISGQFLKFQLRQRFFPLIFTHFLFQSVNFIPNSFLFPNLFSNVVLVINLFFYFYFSRSFFFWCVWCISGHFNFLVFLFLN